MIQIQLKDEHAKLIVEYIGEQTVLDTKDIVLKYDLKSDYKDIDYALQTLFNDLSNKIEEN